VFSLFYEGEASIDDSLQTHVCFLAIDHNLSRCQSLVGRSRVIRPLDGIPEGWVPINDQLSLISKLVAAAEEPSEPSAGEDDASTRTRAMSVESQ
jgi:hypothetical protein